MKNIFLSVLTFISLQASAQIYKTNQGSVKFTSDAPLEMIQAQSLKLTGLLKISDRSFAFTIPMRSFEGFNSELQRTHFNENYVESAKYPDATFEGKIIEDIDFSVPGTYDVRGKGKFVIHGVEQVRIIKCHLVVQKDKILVTSKFSVLLADHNIKIPSVVSKKITEEIVVEIKVVLAPK
jgi:polyisoprenoid-binding protein YceI